MQHLLQLAIILLLTACGTVNSADLEATLQVDNQELSTAIAGAPARIQADATQAWATIRANEANAAQIRNINGQLLATLAISAPPTQSIVQQSGPPASAPLSTPGPITQGAVGNFVLTGVGTSVRGSDGCLTEPLSNFETTLPQIFVGMEALAVSAGVPIRADWYRGSDQVYQFEWVVDQNYDRICVWFSLTQEDVTFVAGAWSVQIFANNQQINGAVNFNFVDMTDD